MFQKLYKRQIYLSSLLFFTVFLVPHGMGIRFKLGQLDIPRTAIILTVILGAYFYFKEWFTARKLIFPSGSVPLVIFSSLIFLSAVLSSNVSASLQLSSQLLTMWIIFPLAYIKLFENDIDGSIFKFSFIATLMLVVATLLVEVSNQTYIFPPEIRTSYFGIEGYEWFSSRVLYRNGVLLPQGAFTWNHSIAGLACVSAGLAIYCYEKFKKLGLIACYLIFMMVFVSGVRAGAAGCLIAIMCYAFWFRQPMAIIHFIGAIIIAEILYLVVLGNHIPIFFDGDINKGWIEGTVNKEIVNTSLTYLNPVVVENLSSFGTIGIKIIGFFVNLTILDEWWAFGFGFGSFQRSTEVLSLGIQYNDPGIIQLIFLESGVIAGGLFTFILVRATVLGLKYEVTKYYSVGIIAWFIFALSSWDVWPVMIVVLFVLKIHKYQYHQIQKLA
ncbi:MAG: hypothetical protein ISQ21_10125 [Alphaproteobacteria bacterium]|nr:hypothetical protein [Alphaproteobacteria bacterium]